MTQSLPDAAEQVAAAEKESALVRILKVVQNRHDTQVKMTF